MLFSGQLVAPRETVEALPITQAYAWNGTYGNFEEGRKGALEPRKLAGLVVLFRDILECSPQEIFAATADLTMIGGEIVYQKSCRFLVCKEFFAWLEAIGCDL